MVEALGFIQNLGFPIFVAVYLLMFWQKVIERLIVSLEKIDESQRLLREEIQRYQEKQSAVLAQMELLPCRKS